MKLLKKVITLATIIAMMTSSLAVTAFAEEDVTAGAQYVSAYASASEVTIGDTVAVTISVAEAEFASFGANIAFDPEYMEYTSFTGNANDGTKVKFTQKDDPDEKRSLEISTPPMTEDQKHFSMFSVGATEHVYLEEPNLVTVTFTAIKSGSTHFVVEENIHETCVAADLLVNVSEEEIIEPEILYTSGDAAVTLTKEVIDSVAAEQTFTMNPGSAKEKVVTANFAKLTDVLTAAGVDTPDCSVIINPDSDAKAYDMDEEIYLYIDGDSYRTAVPDGSGWKWWSGVTAITGRDHAISTDTHQCENLINTGKNDQAACGLEETNILYTDADGEVKLYASLIDSVAAEQTFTMNPGSAKEKVVTANFAKLTDVLTAAGVDTPDCSVIVNPDSDAKAYDMDEEIYLYLDGDSYRTAVPDGSGWKWWSGVTAITGRDHAYNSETHQCENLINTGKNDQAACGEEEVLTPAIITQPESVTAKLKDRIAFTIEAMNVTSYQWQYSKNGEKWYNSSAVGATTDILSLTVSSTNTGNRYRCKLTGADGSILYSDSAVIEQVKEIVIKTQPVSVTAKIGQSVSFTVEADNVASYQWQYTKNGTKWYNSSATGSNTDTMILKASSSNMNYKYRCKLTSADGKVVYTDLCRIDDSVAIITQPENVTAAIGESISFTVEASGAESYQWLYSKDGAKWYKSGTTGSSTASISLKVSTSNKNNLYKCKITGVDGTIIYTNSVGITLE